MTVVVCGLLIQEGRVLMQYRSPSGLCPSMWEYPGGKVEPGESEHDALVREWCEELGVNILVFSPDAEALASVIVPFTNGWGRVSLYVVRLPAGQELPDPTPIGLPWVFVDPLHAAACMPCVPSTYHFLPEVMRLLGRTWPPG